VPVNHHAQVAKEAEAEAMAVTAAEMVAVATAVMMVAVAMVAEMVAAVLVAVAVWSNVLATAHFQVHLPPLAQVAQGSLQDVSIHLLHRHMRYIHCGQNFPQPIGNNLNVSDTLLRGSKACMLPIHQSIPASNQSDYHRSYQRDSTRTDEDHLHLEADGAKEYRVLKQDEPHDVPKDWS
jgi:hypothetical protein